MSSLASKLALSTVLFAMAFSIGFYAWEVETRSFVSEVVARVFPPDPHDQPTYARPDLPPYDWQGTTPEELDVLAAVFRYQFEHNASSATDTGTVAVYVLGLGRGDSRQDPPPELMQRLEGNRRLAVPASEARFGGSRVSHDHHEGDAVYLHVDRLRKVDDDTYDVDGGYWEGVLAASGHSYRVRRTNGSWRVVGEAMRWIS